MFQTAGVLALLFGLVSTSTEEATQTHEITPAPTLSAIEVGCSDECSLRYATEHMCDPEKNNTYETGTFLDRCPEACFLNGFDHGQCPEGPNLTLDEKMALEQSALNYLDDLTS